MKKPLLTYSLALSYSFIIGFSFMFTKTALQYATPFDTLAFRFGISFLTLLIFIFFSKTRLNYRGKNLGKVMVLATLNPVMFFTFQGFGLLHATSAEGGILQAMVPVFTMILAALFLKEIPTKIQRASILLSVAGVLYILIVQGSSFDYTRFLGIIFLLLSNLAFSGYSISARKVLKEFSVPEASFLMMAFGAVVFNFLAIGTHLANGTINQFLLPLVNPGFILPVIYLGVLSSLGTALISNYVLSKLEATKMSVFLNLGTVITIFAGVTLLKEPLFLYHVVGSLMIITGVIGTNYDTANKTHSRKVR